MGAFQQEVVVSLSKVTEVWPVVRATAAEEVTVTAATPLVDTKASDVSQVTKRDTLEKLPLQRTFSGTFQLAPGVIDSGVEISNTNIGINAGGGRQDNTFLYDGVNVTNPFFGDLYQDFAELDIQEVNITRGGVAPEYGRTGGFIVNGVTKSGSNILHGEARLDYSPSGLEADSKEEIQTKFDRFRPGVGVGGPIWKDHLFAYGSVNLFYQDEVDRTNLTGPLPDSNFDIQEYFLKVSATPVANQLIDASFRYRGIDQDNAPDRLRLHRHDRFDDQGDQPRRRVQLVLDGDAELQRRLQVQLQRQPAELEPDRPDRVPAPVRPRPSRNRRVLLRRGAVRGRREPAQRRQRHQAPRVPCDDVVPDELPRRKPSSQAGRLLQRQRGDEGRARQRLGLDHDQQQHVQLPRRSLVLPGALQPEPAGPDLPRPDVRHLSAGPGDLGPPDRQPRCSREPRRVHSQRQWHVRVRPGRPDRSKLGSSPLHRSQPRSTSLHVPRHLRVPVLQAVAAAGRRRVRADALGPRQALRQLRALRQHGQPVLRPIGRASPPLSHGRVLRPRDRSLSSGSHALEQRRQGRHPEHRSDLHRRGRGRLRAPVRQRLGGRDLRHVPQDEGHLRGLSGHRRARRSGRLPLRQHPGRAGVQRRNDPGPQGVRRQLVARRFLHALEPDGELGPRLCDRALLLVVVHQRRPRPLRHGPQPDGHSHRQPHARRQNLRELHVPLPDDRRRLLPRPERPALGGAGVRSDLRDRLPVRRAGRQPDDGGLGQLRFPARAGHPDRGGQHDPRRGARSSTSSTRSPRSRSTRTSGSPTTTPTRTPTSGRGRRSLRREDSPFRLHSCSR